MPWKKTTMTAGGGHEYNVFQQHDMNNCGPSSITMLLKYALDRDVPIGFVQMLCGKMEEGRTIDTGRSRDARWHDWGAGGTTIGWVLLDALKKKWSQLNAYDDPTNGTIGQLRLCSASQPALVRVAWAGGGGHFVVCIGVSGPNMIFLDPYFGIVATPNVTQRTSGNLRYNTINNSFGKGEKRGEITYAIFTDPS